MTPRPQASRSRAHVRALPVDSAAPALHPAHSIRVRRSGCAPLPERPATATAAERAQARLAAEILQSAIRLARQEGFEISFAGRSGLLQQAHQLLSARPGARALGALLVVAGRLWLPRGQAGASYLLVAYDVLQRATARHSLPLTQAACAIYRAVWQLAGAKPEYDQTRLAQCVISTVGSDVGGLHILPAVMTPGAPPQVLDLVTVPANLAAFNTAAALA